jgi:hypothetical protein
LCFIEETHDYLLGKDATVTGKKVADFIAGIRAHLSGCVQHVLLQATGDFLYWQSVKARLKQILNLSSPIGNALRSSTPNASMPVSDLIQGYRHFILISK